MPFWIMWNMEADMDTVIVFDGQYSWVAARDNLVRAMNLLGWTSEPKDDLCDLVYEPEGEYEWDAYSELCQVVSPLRGEGTDRPITYEDECGPFLIFNPDTESEWRSTPGLFVKDPLGGYGTVYWTDDLNDQGTAIREDCHFYQAENPQKAVEECRQDLLSTAGPLESGETIDVGPVSEDDCWSKVPREWTDQEIYDYALSCGLAPEDVTIRRTHPGLQHQTWVHVNAYVYAARIVTKENKDAV